MSAYSGWATSAETVFQDFRSSRKFAAKLTQILSGVIPTLSKKVAQWPAVMTTFGAMRVPEHQSTSRPGKNPTSMMTAPTFVCTVSMVPVALGFRLAWNGRSGLNDQTRHSVSPSDEGHVRGSPVESIVSHAVRPLAFPGRTPLPLNFGRPGSPF